MIVDVIMPKLGESLTEGTIIEWRKKVGDKISKDEILLEIGTDKVDSEIPSPVEGIVMEILAQPNAVVPINEVIAKIETEGKSVIKEVIKEVPLPIQLGHKEKSRILETTGIPQPSVSLKRVKNFYTPLVRSIAQKEGISEKELLSISGSGRGGRVTKKDVMDYLKRRRIEPIEIPTPGAPMVPSLMKGRVEMNRMRQIIAKHMRTSLDTSAHVHLVSECDMTGIVKFIREKQGEFQHQEGFKLTYTPFFVMAVINSIKEFPIFNASLEDTTILYKKNINVGLAVSLEGGLMVPVIRNCEELNFLGVCRKVHDLSDRVRSGKISPDELQGSTFSITNYGIFGNLIGTPIINQPNVAILGIGKIMKHPVVRETDSGDAIIIRSICYLTLGFDHRLIDGAGAGQFLQRIVHVLENMDMSSLL